MQYSFVILLLVSSAFIGFASAGKDYDWGQFDQNDYQLAKDSVSKLFFVGIKVGTTYVFKQKDNLNALTITYIRVTDKKNDGAVAVLTNGGPGSKGATIEFTSERGHGISSLVEVFGR